MTTLDIPVLVVEDDITLRTMLVLMLDKLGLVADSAANGIEAVRRVHEHQYRLVLMDLMMPQMDGYEASGAIRTFEQREKRKPVPIIALTASGSATKSDCLAAGMNDMYLKPTTLSQMKEITEKWLSTALSNN